MQLQPSIMGARDNRYSKNSISCFCTDYCIGAFTGFLTKLCLTPLENQRLRDIYNSIRYAGGTKLKNANIDPNDNSPLGRLAKAMGATNTKSQNKIPSINPWKLSNFVRFANMTALNLSIYDFLKFHYMKNSTTIHKIPDLVHFASGGMAGTIALLIIHPIDSFHMKNFQNIRNSKMEFLRQTLANHGISYFYKGFMSSCLGVAFYRSLFFGVFDSGKARMSAEKRQNILYNFLLGWGATYCGFLLANPIDNVRKRVSMTNALSSFRNENRTQVDFLDMAKMMKNSQGLWSFFRGGLGGIYRSVGGGIVLAVYDRLQTAKRIRQT